MDQNNKTLKGAIACLLLIGVFCSDVLWNAPSPILEEIMASLGIDMARGGVLMSVIMLIYSASTYGMDLVSRRYRANSLFLVGLVVMAAGEVLHGFVGGFSAMMACRSLLGVGMGIMAPVYASLVMENFTEEERPLINTIYAALPYLGSYVVLLAVIPLYKVTDGSWQMTLSLLGLPVVITAVIWGLILKKVKSPVPEKEERAGIREAASMREVRLLLLADGCDMWGYTFISSFLPTFFRQEAGLSLEKAASLTSLFPIAGIIGCFIGGGLMIRIGRRKPFTYPMHLMIAAGTWLIVLFDGPLRVLGVILAGFGNAAWAPALYTMPMEFEGVTPRMAGAIFCFVFGTGYIAGFLSPFIGGLIGDRVGLGPALIMNGFVAVTAAAATFAMKETGPGKSKKETSG